MSPLREGPSGVVVVAAAAAAAVVAATTAADGDDGDGDDGDGDGGDGDGLFICLFMQLVSYFHIWFFLVEAHITRSASKSVQRNEYHSIFSLHGSQFIQQVLYNAMSTT